jgi:hypothetical protein
MKGRKISKLRNRKTNSEIKETEREEKRGMHSGRGSL